MNNAKTVLRMSDAPNRPKPEATAVERTFLTRRDVAKLFGVSASTITRWARTGLVGSVRTPGGHYRFRTEDVLRQVQAAEGGKEIAS